MFRLIPWLHWLWISSAPVAMTGPWTMEAEAPQRSVLTVENDSPKHTNQHTNRLAQEKSPYLLQHAHNPVDWHPWGAEAFEKARAEDKPIFLSIGYSTCHWCHVMERESFEDEEVARFLNEHFVSIKVDREERPDVDKIYMTFVQATRGEGGWPLNVFLTPELKPFFGGTYFPPEPKFGRPSFLQALEQIRALWSTQRSDILASAKEIHQQLVNHTKQTLDEDAVLAPNILTRALDRFKAEYDPKNGGFGGAPKFPRPTQPSFMLQIASKQGDNDAVEMVLHTARKMAHGGIYDQLGGGFARYAVDAQWLVPHFEKMLYDNAQLLDLYLDAYLISQDEEFAAVARDIIRYAATDMTHPQGGFYSAEDADSEGKEGKFYVWTTAELRELLHEEEFRIATRYFGLTDKGNFIDHSDPNPEPNLNVLSVVDPKLSDYESALLKAAKQKMLERRSKRVRPGLDDKILASWNGMMLGAVSRAYAILGESEHRQMAGDCLRFIQQNLWDQKEKTLYHRWREGERHPAQLQESYANVLAGALDYFEATLDPDALKFSIDVAEAMIAKFYDPQDGGFWQSLAGADDLIMRIKEDYDGAEPSGNSVAALALLRLAAITDRSEFRTAAEKTLKLFAERMRQLPQATPHMLSALDFYLHEPRRAVLVSDSGAASRQLLQAIHSVYQPNKVVLGVEGPVEPMAKEFPKDQAPMVYLCTGTACQPPTNEPDKIKSMLTDQP